MQPRTLCLTACAKGREKLAMNTIQGKQFRSVHGNIETSPMLEPHASRGRWPSFLMMSVVAVVVARLATEASAETLFQEARRPGTGETSSQPLRIEVSHFAGDTVHGTVWDKAGAKGRSMRLHARELVGMQWTEEACDAARCETITFRIAAAAQDTAVNTMPQHGSNGDVWLHRVEYAPASAPDQWLDVCGEGDPDATMGLFVDGYWSDDGVWHAGGWTYACPSGVIAKCVRSWGYKPWKTLPSPTCGEVSLQPLHQACTRAARADYCGDGSSHTRDGTLVDMFDACGLNVREDAPGFHEESAFDEGGALSVSIPRWPTATATETGWRFATCERPRQARQGGTPALIYVWSDPTKGRPVSSASVE